MSGRASRLKGGADKLLTQHYRGAAALSARKVLGASQNKGSFHSEAGGGSNGQGDDDRGRGRRSDNKHHAVTQGLDMVTVPLHVGFCFLNNCHFPSPCALWVWPLEEPSEVKEVLWQKDSEEAQARLQGERLVH